MREPYFFVKLRMKGSSKLYNAAAMERAQSNLNSHKFKLNTQNAKHNSGSLKVTGTRLLINILILCYSVQHTAREMN